ncbi:hypothetical protein NYP20_00695 [Pseudomonas sp. N3-W]|uniref:Uncharacterized protein n=1 Tax=Pseudomonas fungipugnans TaxID=3024217 RepID=A0ABT6QQ86_9PSED|nr:MULTISPECIES: hypothetical protein [unclassified Pseudomonas]MDI2593065.1 hypothetical protein [Pseudomonas sp. 681]UWF52376.1 hypothetical protein NYP20_00695 [Pseudomonas sp. N3-W]
MKAHQSRVIGAVAVTQQIPAGLHFAQLAIEAQSRRDVLLRGLMAVGGVSDGVGFAIDDFANDRLTVVDGQQDSTLRNRILLTVSHVGTFAKERLLNASLVLVASTDFVN